MSNRRMLFVPALLLAGAAPLAACNSITGVDELVISNSAGAGGGPGVTTGGFTTAMTSGDAVSSSTGEPLLVAAQGVSIEQIAIYQGVKRVLMNDGSVPSSKVPLIAGRPSLVRVFATADGTYDGSPITALLDLGDGSPIEIQATLAGAPSDGALESTINFDVPAAAMAPGLTYRVDLFQPPEHSSGNNPRASYPESGASPIPAQSSGKSLKIELVPIA